MTGTVLKHSGSLALAILAAAALVLLFALAKPFGGGSAAPGSGFVRQWQTLGRFNLTSKLAQLARPTTPHGKLEARRTALPIFRAGSFGGLNNQRRCLLRGLLLARQNNMSLVLPSWRLGGPLDFSPVVKPFQYLYEVEPLAAAAIQANFNVVLRMPADKYEKCVMQLQTDNLSGFLGNQTEERLQLWRETQGVACFQGHVSFKWWSPGAEESDTFWRQHLTPAQPFRSQAARILEAMSARFGTQNFSVLHARIEEDFRRMCIEPATAGWRRQEGRQCVLEDHEMLRELNATHGLARGTVLYVCSGHPNVTAALPKLCAFYTCVKRTDLVIALDPRIHQDLTSNAFVEFLFALHFGTTFYGNTFSTFSKELVAEFEAEGKPAYFLNPPLVGP